MTVRVLDGNGTLVADDLGPAGTHALLLLHGFTGDRSTWSPVAERLAVRRRVIVPDLPGHGATSLATVPDMAGTTRLLAALLGTLGVRVVTPIGYSMGGRLALHFALTAPIAMRALVLESASPGLATAAERRARQAADDALAATIERDGVAAFVQQWEAQPLFATQSPALRERLRAGRLRASAPGLAASLRRVGLGVQPWLGDDLPALRCPVLLVSGACDEKFSRIAAVMTGAIPDARHVLVPDAGHAVHLEKPDAVVAALETFLDQREDHRWQSSG